MSPYLTLFTIPKPFTGHISVIQRNALRSWKALDEVHVILFGDDQGVEDAAREFEMEHVAGIPTNEKGTPLLDRVFEEAAKRARTDFLGYANADIILLLDVLDAAKSIDRERFLMVGQRWDLDITEQVEFRDGGASVRGLLQAKGELHPPAGSDYFIYPRAIEWGFPPFAVGRPGWDNWLIYRARSLGIPVIDATVVTTVIHQNHDYAHVPSSVGVAWEGEEADRNRQLAGGHDHLFTLLDATHVLTQNGVRRALDSERTRRRLASWPVLHPWSRPAFRMLSRILASTRRRA